MPSVVDTNVTPRSVKRLDGLQDVKSVAAQPVQLPHHHRVTLAHVVEKCGQAWTVIAGTRHPHRSVGSRWDDDTMPLVPVQCWLRTFKIVSGGYSATCFVISRHDRQWLITAKHFTDVAAAAGGSLQLLPHEGGEDTNISPEWVPLAQPGADIAVFSLGEHKLARDELTLPASAEGLALSQDVYFLGYPLSGRVPFVGTLPFVKRAIASARGVINGVNVWLLDGHNNPGFSGGPVVFNLGAAGGPVWQVLGVVSAYVTEAIAVTGGEGEVPANSGIVVVYDIKHAIDAIDAFVANPTAAQTD